MNRQLLRYELRLLGPKVILPPLLVIVLLGALAILLHILGVNTSHALMASQEMFLPLAMGAIVAATGLHDPALELQLTMPTNYRRTAMYRFLLVLIWAACVSFLTNTILFSFKLGYQPQQIQSWALGWQFLVGQLIWLAPLLWFMSVGFCITILTHSISASGAVLGGIWILQALFIKNLLETNAWLQSFVLFPTTLMPDAPFWLTNRLELLAVAIILIPINWLLLRNTESLLKSASAE
ncbi:hypothetical protein [Dictyobacter formicarum]|uniref:ABC transporter permease n=1 Tax=Dictyobacter formicarum TaxID=2778368 RepID=A0ABQ3VPZ1_9CHLR|nr:hypothetical protein [Dictyobacter formicarum]GHO88332.1 hypothetical protein KSZ_63380 [Dictyobacter formicarum]